MGSGGFSWKNSDPESFFFFFFSSSFVFHLLYFYFILWVCVQRKNLLLTLLCLSFSVWRIQNSLAIHFVILFLFTFSHHKVPNSTIETCSILFQFFGKKSSDLFLFQIFLIYSSGYERAPLLALKCSESGLRHRQPIIVYTDSIYIQTTIYRYSTDGWNSRYSPLDQYCLATDLTSRWASLVYLSPFLVALFKSASGKSDSFHSCPLFSTYLYRVFSSFFDPSSYQMTTKVRLNSSRFKLNIYLGTFFYLVESWRRGDWGRACKRKSSLWFLTGNIARPFSILLLISTCVCMSVCVCAVCVLLCASSKERNAKLELLASFFFKFSHEFSLFSVHFPI